MIILLFAIFIAISVILVFINYKYLIYCLFASLIIGQLGRLSPSGESSSAILLIDIANALYVAIGTFFILAKRTRPQPFFPTIPIAGFFGCIVLSLLFGARFLSTDQLMIALFYAIRLLFMFAAFYVTRYLYQTTQDKERLVQLFIRSGLILVVLGYLQLLFFPSFAFMAQFGWDPHEGRLLSTFFDPNFFGMFLVMLASVLLARILMFAKEQNNLFAWSCLGATVLAIFLTFSRSSYLAFLVSFLLIMTIRSWKLVVLALFSILLIGSSIPRVRVRVTDALRVDTTAKDRIESWRQAGKIIRQNVVLGVGYNAYGPAQLRYNIRENLIGHSTHGSDSSFLLILATTGIMGFIFYILFWISLFILAMGRYRISHSAIGLALLGIIPSYIIHSQFVNGLLYPLLFIPFALLVASDLERGKE
jgi:putative inorganic carbon (hco3(-)) transporter